MTGPRSTYRVLRAIGNSKSDIVIGSPYFIPGAPGLERLAEVRRHGVNVEVFTNSLASNDEPFASAAYGRYRVPIAKDGHRSVRNQSDRDEKRSADRQVTAINHRPLAHPNWW